MPLKEVLERVWVSQIWRDASSDRCPDNRGSCVRNRRSMVLCQPSQRVMGIQKPA